ncbi:tetratricopeptide repeat protein, partial [Nocardia fluminea]|uniref:tetratricopeptide repeat protein n=1 Tax=Nocardia fluminea TaxID=134984 RepID=UPI003D115C6D
MSANDPIATRLAIEGLALLAEDPLEMLMRGLRTEEAIQRSNASQATFYRKFETKQKYLRAVMALLAEIVSRRSEHTTIKLRNVYGDSDISRLEDLVAELAVWMFKHLAEHGETSRYLLALTLAHSDAKVNDALNSAYSSQASVWTGLFAEAARTRGMVLRPRYTFSQFGQAISSMVDGFALRYHASPNDNPRVDQAVATAARALVDGFFTREPAADLGGAGGTKWEPADAQDARRIVISSARVLIGVSGYDGVSLSKLAEDAAIPELILRRLFPSKEHLLVGALKADFDDLEQRIEDDLLIGIDAHHALGKHLTRLAKLTIEEPAFMQAWLTQVAYSTDNGPLRSDMDFPRLAQRIIQQDPRFAEGRPVLPAPAVAETVTTMLIGQCLAHPERDPRDHADLCLAFLDGGMFAGAETPGNERLDRRAADRGNTEAMIRLGQLERSRGHFEEAEHWYLNAAGEGNVEAMTRLGQLIQESGRLDEAEYLFRRATAQGNVEAMTRLGQLIQESGRLDEAETWYRRAADEGNVEAMTRLGQLIQESGRLDEAETWYRRAADEGNVEAMTRLGQLIQESGRLDEAETWYRRA